MDFYSKLKKYKEGLDKVNLDDVSDRYRQFLRRLPDISHLKNIVLFSAIASILILILFPQRFAALYGYLPKRPLPGGVYEEGLVGRVEQFNPLYSVTNSAEQSVTKLIFSGLTKKNGTRDIVPDLARNWDISPDGKNYTFYLKQGIKWQDGHPLTADDVVFTINAIQNPDARSPYLEVWKNVQIEKKNDETVTFKLPNPFASFLSITDFAVVPKHLLENIPARNLKTAEFSVNPVGTGPFRFVETKEIRDSQEISLEPSKYYYGKKPYLDKFIFKTYPDSRALLDGYIKKEVKGVERMPVITDEAERKLPTIQGYETAMPNYDVLYFNIRKGITKEKSLRQAISLAIDRPEITKNVYLNQAEEIYSPILPGYPGYDPKLKSPTDLSAAKKALTDGGFELGPDGILKKGETLATITLVTSNEAMLSAEADLIAVDLGLLGIKVKIEKYPMGALVQDKIRPRDFDVLLISQNLGIDADLYPFWHGTQINDPGLNFSGFSDRRADKLLEQGRVSIDKVVSAAKYKSAVEIIWQEFVAVYTVRPSYKYGISADIKGVKVGRLTDPGDRFWDVTNWYINDERADKK